MTGPTTEVTSELLDAIGTPTVVAAAVLLVKSQVDAITVRDMTETVDYLKGWPEEERATFVLALIDELLAIESWAMDLQDALDPLR